MLRSSGKQLRSYLVETFKILYGFYNINKGLFFDLDDGGRRGHEKKLFKRRFRLDTRKFVFSNRVVDSWNSLSAQCAQCASALLTHLRSMFQFDWSRNPVFIWKCDV